MQYRMIMTLLGGAVCVAALAGCTTTSQGQPQPPATGTTEPSTTGSPGGSSSRSTLPSDGSLPSDGAPKVANPLDTSHFQQNPCQMLTPAQVQELNLDPQGEPREAPLGLACNWHNLETGGLVSIDWADKDPRGLSAPYRANKAGKYKYFMELPEIEGYPAIASDVVDTRDVGRCSVEVGVSDTVAFGLSGQLSRANVGKKDPCEMTAQVAGMALQTMKAGG